ncbi:hypothetical protein [Nocardioides alcanivorans]|uniref:hypothetical protein n=1 Tax=Nocardioides alcanivorans TaxID=2897352 RepID=UPI001F448574|nr:hypothetical protein [Nocardioides alcanivorans]
MRIRRSGDLPGRFLFVLDDGHEDLLDRAGDLGLVALDEATAQLRVGDGWGAVVPLTSAAHALASLARDFVARRGHGPAAAWHVQELTEPLAPLSAASPRLPKPSRPRRTGASPAVSTRPSPTPA